MIGLPIWNSPLEVFKVTTCFWLVPGFTVSNSLIFLLTVIGACFVFTLFSLSLETIVPTAWQAMIEVMHSTVSDFLEPNVGTNASRSSFNNRVYVPLVSFKEQLCYQSWADSNRRRLTYQISARTNRATLNCRPNTGKQHQTRTKSIVKRTKYGPNKPQKHELWRNMGRNMGVFDQNNRVFATATDQTLLIYGKSLNRWYATPITAKSERWTRFWSKYGWYFSNIRPIDDLKTMNYWRHRWVYRPNTSVLNQSGRESNPCF